jgi:hypothetical protein
VRKNQEISVEQLHIKCLPELRRLVERDYAKTKPPITLNDIIVKIIADHYGRPELGVTPRKRMGRPPKTAVPA